MADIKKIKLPSGNEYNIIDASALHMIMHEVTLNADGTVSSYPQDLTYQSVIDNLNTGIKEDVLVITWGSTVFGAEISELTDAQGGDVKFICNVEHAGVERYMVFTLDPQDVLQTTMIAAYMIKPSIVWQESDPANYLKGIQSNLSASPAWQLTDLNMAPFKRIKIYSCAGQSAGATASASTTPAMVLEMSLDPRAAIAEYGGNYVASAVVQKPNDANRLATLTCAVSADKTKFAVLRQTNLYGTAATSNNDVNANVFLIEGYVD